MALIYADDFQQCRWMSVKTSSANGWTPNAVTNTQISTGFESMGFYRTAQCWFNNNGTTQYFTPVSYDQSAQQIILSNTNSPNGGGADATGIMGLKRDITVKGDTLFFSIRWLSQAAAVRLMAGDPLLKFNDMFTVGFSTTGTLVVNGVDTGFSVVYEVDTALLTEVILGPDYMEVWVGETQVTRVARSAIPITFFTVGFEKSRASASGAKSFNFRFYSLIVADNSAGNIRSRIGRKQVISCPIETISTTGQIEVQAGTAQLDAIRQPVQDATANIGALVGGNIFSPTPFAKSTFTATIPANGQKVLGACIHVQAKKRNPTNDGVVVVAWVNVGGTEYVASVRPEIRARWKGWCAPIEVPDISTATLTFGYTHDYPAGGTVFVDDRTKVEVYGEPAVSLPALPWQSKVTTTANAQAQTATYSAYVFDYAKSNLDIAKTNVNNLTYLQEQ